MNDRNDGIQSHPTEEQLMDLAIDTGSPEHRRHIETCPECARLVNEFREVSRQLHAVKEEEVPEHLERRILSITRHGSAHGLLAGVGTLLQNPFFIAVAVVMVVLLLYFLVGTEVFKEP
jgi:anti-sigma factor RsiW